MPRPPEITQTLEMLRERGYALWLEHRKDANAPLSERRINIAGAIGAIEREWPESEEDHD